MDAPPIHASIHEIDDGPFYTVKLHSAPRVGELVQLYAFVDSATGHDAMHFYEVVQVLHDLHDDWEKAPRHRAGAHAIKVFVKRSESPYFQM